MLLLPRYGVFIGENYEPTLTTNSRLVVDAYIAGLKLFYSTWRTRTPPAIKLREWEEWSEEVA